MEDNWIFFIVLKNENTLKLYPGSDEIEVSFHCDDDLPLKILMKIRNHLLSYTNVVVKTLEDMALDKFNETVNYLNYNIAINKNVSDFQTMLYFRSVWINRTLLYGIRRSMYSDRNMLKCFLFIYLVAYLSIYLFYKIIDHFILSRP